LSVSCLVIISTVTYVVTVGVVRISLLVFFLQTFPDRRFQLITKILIGYVGLHTIIFALLLIFQCSPVNLAWDKTLNGQCLDLTAVTYAGAGVAVSHDIFTLLLPLNELRKLKMSAGKKLGVIVIFMIGGLYVLTPFPVQYLKCMDANYDHHSSGFIASCIRLKEIGSYTNDVSRDPDITCKFQTTAYSLCPVPMTDSYKGTTHQSSCGRRLRSPPLSCARASHLSGL
jgi:hypothetical protein